MSFYIKIYSYKMERYSKWMLTTENVDAYIGYVNDLKYFKIDERKQEISGEKEVRMERSREKVEKPVKIEYKKQFRHPKDFDYLFWNTIRIYYLERWLKIDAEMREKPEQFAQMDFKYEFVKEWSSNLVKAKAREVVTKVRWGDVLNDVGSSIKIEIETFITLVEVLSHIHTEMEKPDIGSIVLCRTRCVQFLKGDDFENVVLWVDLKKVDKKYVPHIGKYDERIDYIEVPNIWKPLYSISKYKVPDLETLITTIGIQKEDRKYKKGELYELISNYLDTM